MTNEKLQEGNDLKYFIGEAKKMLDSQLSVLRELELNDFTVPVASVKLDRKDCFVKTKSLIKFLSAEIDATKEELKNLQTQFEEL